MKLSSRTIYGMHALLTLAREHKRGPIMAREIASRQRLPANYLEQVMVLLRKAKLVSATRGARGGYVLARPPAEISVAEVVEVFEGPIDLAGGKSESGCCSLPELCPLQDIWPEASQTLRDFFQKITLAKLVEQQQRKEKSRAITYTI